MMDPETLRMIQSLRGAAPATGTQMLGVGVPPITPPAGPQMPAGELPPPTPMPQGILPSDLGTIAPPPLPRSTPQSAVEPETVELEARRRRHPRFHPPPTPLAPPPTPLPPTPPFANQPLNQASMYGYISGTPHLSEQWTPIENGPATLHGQPVMAPVDPFKVMAGKLMPPDQARLEDTHNLANLMNAEFAGR